MEKYKRHIRITSVSTWNEELELPDGSYFISDIQDYIEYILKNHGGKQLILQQKYVKTEQKIESPLKLKQDIILNFKLLNQ